MTIMLESFWDKFSVALVFGNINTKFIQKFEIAGGNNYFL